MFERNEAQRAFYHSAKWTRTRRAFLESRHWTCERCGAPATLAHHRKYVTPENVSDPRITLDWGNLEALCIDCHAREHFGAQPTAEGLRFDGEGNLTTA